MESTRPRIVVTAVLWAAMPCWLWAAANAPTDHGGITVKAPVEGQSFTALPVQVEIAHARTLSPGSIRVVLNGRDVSERFAEVRPGTLTASFSLSDGVLPQGNQLNVGLKDRLRPLRVTRRFSVSVPTGAASAVVGPDGGQVSVAGIGSVTFATGSLESSRTVKVTVTSQAVADSVFTALTAPLLGGVRLPYEVRVNTGSIQPSSNVQATLELPAGSSIPAGFQPYAFGQAAWGLPEEGENSFTLLAPSEGAPADPLTVDVPPWLFSNRVSDDGTFEAVLLLAAAPATAQPVFELAASDCPPLENPLAGELDVKSEFGPRDIGASAHHDGLDLHADPGTPVHSMQDGKVVGSGYQGTCTRTVAGKSVKSTVKSDSECAGGTLDGAGYYMIVTNAENGFSTAYFHLQKGSPKPVGTPVEAGVEFAESDTSGGANGPSPRGPHLHIELQRRPAVGIGPKQKIDPASCFCQGAGSNSFSCGHDGTFVGPLTAHGQSSTGPCVWDETWNLTATATLSGTAGSLRLAGSRTLLGSPEGCQSLTEGVSWSVPLTVSGSGVSGSLPNSGSYSWSFSGTAGASALSGTLSYGLNSPYSGGGSGSGTFAKQ
jgi:murein DD-endopeptidase MepM/ murein hydrolase activator NlpD